MYKQRIGVYFRNKAWFKCHFLSSIDNFLEFNYKLANKSVFFFSKLSHVLEWRGKNLPSFFDNVMKHNDNCVKYTTHSIGFGCEAFKSSFFGRLLSHYIGINFVCVCNFFSRLHSTFCFSLQLWWQSVPFNHEK